MPIEVSIGVKDVKRYKSFESMSYYFSVGLNYKTFIYVGSENEFGYKYNNQFEPPFYYDINTGDLFQTFGAEISYGQIYHISDLYYLDLCIGYKAYLQYFKSNFDAVRICKINTTFYMLEDEKNYLNPRSFYVKLGFGFSL